MGSVQSCSIFITYIIMISSQFVQLSVLWDLVEDNSGEKPFVAISGNFVYLHPHDNASQQTWSRFSPTTVPDNKRQSGLSPTTVPEMSQGCPQSSK